MSSVEKKIVIDKPRLISSFLAELEAANAVILATDSKSRYSTLTRISCKVESQFSESEVKFLDAEPNEDIVECVCCFAGQRIQFLLESRKNGAFRIPSKLEVVELRGTKRLTFGSRMYSAELVSERGTTYGYAIDLNHHYVAVDIDASFELKNDDSVKVIVRLVNTNSDIFYRKCRVSQISPKRDGGARVVLNTNAERTGVFKDREFDRFHVENVGLNLTSPSFSEISDEIQVSVKDIGLGGLRCEFLSKHRFRQSVLPGVILYSRTLRLNFLVIRSDDEQVSLVPALVDLKALSDWYRFYERTAEDIDEKSAMSRRELADILTQSGLLKGKRRGSFGKALSDHLVSTNQESALLALRRIVVADNSDAGCHLTARRVSEKLWFFTDGASLGRDPADYRRVFIESVKAMSETHNLSGAFPRYFCAIVGSSVVSTTRLFEELASTQSFISLRASQFSIKKAIASNSDRGVTKLTRMSSMNAADRYALVTSYTPALAEAFSNGDGTHAVLDIELAKLGPYHKALTSVLKLSNGKQFIVHRLFTHNVWNTTGVTNSVFVLLPEGIDTADLSEALFCLGSEEIAKGTDDFLLIYLPSMKTVVTALDGQREFDFYLYDLQQDSNFR